MHRKWQRMLGPSGGDLAGYQQRKPHKVKRRVRKGIPDQFRGIAWQRMSGGRALLQQNPGVFAGLQVCVFRKGGGIDNVI